MEYEERETEREIWEKGNVAREEKMEMTRERVAC